MKNAFLFKTLALLLLLGMVLGITLFGCGSRCTYCDATGDCPICEGEGGDFLWFDGERFWRNCGICRGSGTCTQCDGDGRR